MKRKVLLFLGITFAAAIMSCSPESASLRRIEKPPSLIQETQAQVKEAWEVEWERVLVEAKKEGKVVLYTNAASDITRAFINGFQKKTGIILEIISGRGAELTRKLLTERRAELYLVDVYIGGTTTALGELKPRGVFSPIDKDLLLPEVKDPNAWWEKKLPFLDKEGKLLFSYNTNVSGDYVHINSSMVKKSELTSYFDLLDPRWKNKISINDPSTPGKGLSWFTSTLVLNFLDLDYMKSLAKQELMITRDERLQVEWLARGRYPVAIAAGPEAIKDFQAVGAPVEEIVPKEHGEHLTSTGSGNIAIVDKAPHRNAAIYFMNWLLSREGQALYTVAAATQSGRGDVPVDHLPQFQLRVPGRKYYRTDSEEFVLKKQEYSELAKELFAQKR